MLATSISKMTGLDLVGGSMGVASISSNGDSGGDSSKRSSTSSEEMLSTPKLLPDSATSTGGGLTPHFPKSMLHSPSTMTAAAAASGSSNNNTIANESDMLTTPVVTTPKTSDLWPNHSSTSPHLLRFQGSSPTGASSESSHRPSLLGDLTPREPPSDLPMDSDIGLRSPCEGIVAKRREKFRRKQQSSLSDSNSCDTPTSENSPRDLSIAKTPEGAGSGSKLGSKPSTPTLVKRSPTPPALATPPVQQAPSNGSPSFKHPHRPEALRLKDVAELPAHYTPSPLTVPSPNWMAINQFLDKVKTPKELDNSVFDFLTPSTPISRLYRESGLDSDRYSRLSPRHSPRLTIPEVPTDLSNGSNRMPTDLSKNMPQKMEEETEAAEDLSISRNSAPADTTSANRFSTETPPLQGAPGLQIKQEVTPRSPSPLHTTHMPPELIKIERSSIGISQQHPAVSQHNSFEFRAHGVTGPPPNYPTPMSTMGVYRRYISQSPPQTSSNYRDHHNSSPVYQPPAHPALTHPWYHSAAMDEEASMSPPQFSSPIKAGQGNAISVKTTDSLMASEFKKAKLEVSPGGGGGNNMMKKQRASGKGKANKAPSSSGSASAKEPPRDAAGNKRVYSCPHCQRSYDWNYNLNRHLKYECGKENAFQCSKCGRKFPHKQNCVYHLKRKHKIVCETIDQYMTNGLVIFKGTSNPGGQTLANPQLT